MRYVSQIADAQWAAARALVEGEFPTHARVAACMGVHTTTVSHRASEYSWKALDFRHPRVKAMHRGMVALAAAAREGEDVDPVLDEAGADAVAAASGGPAAWAEAEAATELEPLSDLPPGERIARIGAILTKRTEAILHGVEAGRPIESRQIAALASLVQLSERIAVLAREEREANKEKSDEEFAAMYEKIDNRIAYLAAHYARNMIVQIFDIAPAVVDAKLPPVDEDTAREQVSLAWRAAGPTKELYD